MILPGVTGELETQEGRGCWDEVLSSSHTPGRSTCSQKPLCGAAGREPRWAPPHLLRLQKCPKKKKKIHPCKQGGFALSAVAAKGMNLEPKLTRPDPLSLGWSFRGDFYGATFLLGLWRQAKNRGEKNRISDTDGYLAVFWNQRSRFLQLENGKGRDMKRRGGPGWPRLCPEDTSPAGLCIPLPTMEEIFQGSPYIPQDPRSGCCSSCSVSVPCPQARAPAPRATCVRPSRHPVFQNALGASASVL